MDFQIPYIASSYNIIYDEALLFDIINKQQPLCANDIYILKFTVKVILILRSRFYPFMKIPVQDQDAP